MQVFWERLKLSLNQEALFFKLWKKQPFNEGLRTFQFSICSSTFFDRFIKTLHVNSVKWKIWSNALFFKDASSPNMALEQFQVNWWVQFNCSVLLWNDQRRSNKGSTLANAVCMAYCLLYIFMIIPFVQKRTVYWA